jgi:hypothetical protein
LLDALKMYKAENEGKEFNMMHCFQKLQGCNKWDRVRRTLNEGRTGEEGPIPMAPSTAGLPTGTKKAKVDRNAGSSGGCFEAGSGLFVDSMNANSKEIYDRSDARWKEIKETQKEKLVLETERVLAAKIDAEATLIKAKNDAKSFELTKMVEEAKILSMPLEAMDPLTKTWYMMIRDRIAKELMSAHEPAVEEPAVEEPPVVQPEVEEPPVVPPWVEVEEVDEEVEEVPSSL